MTVLLDTHAFIWWDENPEKLGPKALAACQYSENVLVLSVASIWEMQLKQMIGKLNLRKSLAEMLQDQAQQNGLQIQSIDQKPVMELSTLPFHHRDPFDRILIAQAKVNGWAIATHDRTFADYGVPIIWA